MLRAGDKLEVIKNGARGACCTGSIAEGKQKGVEFVGFMCLAERRAAAGAPHVAAAMLQPCWKVCVPPAGRGARKKVRKGGPHRAAAEQGAGQCCLSWCSGRTAVLYRCAVFVCCERGMLGWARPVHRMRRPPSCLGCRKVPQVGYIKSRHHMAVVLYQIMYLRQELGAAGREGQKQRSSVSVQALLLAVLLRSVFAPPQHSAALTYSRACVPRRLPSGGRRRRRAWRRAPPPPRWHRPHWTACYPRSGWRATAPA